jgi:hypothetical protein
MRQTTIVWIAGVLALALSRPVFAAESAPQQAQLTVLCQKRSDTHCDESFAGTTKWSTERLPVGADQKPRVAVRADVEIPRRGVTMKWLMYPDADKDSPASQIDEIQIGLPAELQTAKPLVPGGFLTMMANSALEMGDDLETGAKDPGKWLGDWSFMHPLNPKAERNLKLIEEHCWLQVHTVEFPVVNGAYGLPKFRLVISMEKGKAGARAFANAFAAWGTTYAERSCALSFAPPAERQAADYRIIAEARPGLVDGVFGKR